MKRLLNRWTLAAGLLALAPMAVAQIPPGVANPNDPNLTRDQRILRQEELLRAQVAQRAQNAAAAPAAALPGLYADPTLVAFDKTYYIYPTTDGTEGWMSTFFTCWSSPDLVHWKNEGKILDLPKDLSWADARAWAPTIAAKNGKYYFYYSADTNIGVAVADTPTGPFKDPLGHPLVRKGAFGGQMIDPMVFTDTDGASYLYWGQGQLHMVRLHDDMTSFTMSEVKTIHPDGYNEGPFVFKRDGTYYLMWSEHDTRDPRYGVAYATGKTPFGPWEQPNDNLILHQKGIAKGTGHHSVLRIPGTNEWVICYHRFAIPNGNGYNREVCISPMGFDAGGHILPVDPLVGVGETPIR